MHLLRRLLISAPLIIALTMHADQSMLSGWPRLKRILTLIGICKSTDCKEHAIERDDADNQSTAPDESMPTPPSGTPPAAPKLNQQDASLSSKQLEKCINDLKHVTEQEQEENRKQVRDAADPLFKELKNIVEKCRQNQQNINQDEEQLLRDPQEWN